MKRSRTESVAYNTHTRTGTQATTGTSDKREREKEKQIERVQRTRENGLTQ